VGRGNRAATRAREPCVTVVVATPTGARWSVGVVTALTLRSCSRPLEVCGVRAGASRLAVLMRECLLPCLVRWWRRPRRAPVRGVPAPAGIRHGLIVEQVRDGKELQAWIALVPPRDVEADASGFHAHRAGGEASGDEATSRAIRPLC
jgi:hypothetical protein